MWNKKEVHGFDTGWTMWPWPLTSPMTLTSDFSRSNFKIAVSQELLFDWCETKRRHTNQILGWLYGLILWPHPWPWPCSFKVWVWNSLIWGMGGLTDMELKGCELIIHDHDRDLWVTMVGWVDVMHSDWGDFRHWGAVDISSFFMAQPSYDNTCTVFSVMIPKVHVLSSQGYAVSNHTRNKKGVSWEIFNETQSVAW